MDLKKRVQDIKKEDALKKCFKESFFSVCPISDIHPMGYPNREILKAAHCIDLCAFSEEEAAELKRLTEEAIYWVRPWWSLF